MKATESETFTQSSSITINPEFNTNVGYPQQLENIRVGDDHPNAGIPVNGNTPTDAEKQVDENEPEAFGE